MTKRCLLLTPYIPLLISTSSVTEVITLDNVTTNHCDHSLRTEEPWTRCGGISLTMKDLQQITGGRELTDKHVNVYQNLMKSHFPDLGGFQSTLFQMKTPLQLQNHITITNNSYHKVTLVLP